MLQPAENIHLIGVDPLDPTRSTYVATGDSGQVHMMMCNTVVGSVNSCQNNEAACFPWHSRI